MSRVSQHSPVRGGVYSHYKGQRYVVVGTALHTETEELLVIYRNIRSTDARNLFARPLSMWNELVGASQTPRFLYRGMHRDSDNP